MGSPKLRHATCSHPENDDRDRSQERPRRRRPDEESEVHRHSRRRAEGGPTHEGVKITARYHQLNRDSRDACERERESGRRRDRFDEENPRGRTLTRHSEVHSPVHKGASRRDGSWERMSPRAQASAALRDWSPDFVYGGGTDKPRTTKRREESIDGFRRSHMTSASSPRDHRSSSKAGSSRWEYTDGTYPNHWPQRDFPRGSSTVPSLAGLNIGSRPHSMPTTDRRMDSSHVRDQYVSGGLKDPSPLWRGVELRHECRRLSQERDRYSRGPSDGGSYSNRQSHSRQTHDGRL